MSLDDAEPLDAAEADRPRSRERMRPAGPEPPARRSRTRRDPPGRREGDGGGGPWSNGLDVPACWVYAVGQFLSVILAASVLMPWVCYRNSKVIVASTGEVYDKFHTGIAFPAGWVVLGITVLVSVAGVVLVAVSFFRPHRGLVRLGVYAPLVWSVFAPVCVFSQRFSILNAHDETAEILSRPSLLDPYIGSGIATGTVTGMLAAVLYLVVALRVEGNLGRLGAAARRGSDGPNSEH